MRFAKERCCDPWQVQNEIAETSTINSDHAAIDRISYTGKRVDIGKKQWDIYLEFVQSAYSVSNSLGAISLHLLTPGWMAPRPRRMRTCSTLQTIGTTSSLFNFVYTVCRPPTKCFRNSSNACGRQINSRPSTMNAATLTPRYSISRQVLFSALLWAGGGELYTGLAVGAIIGVVVEEMD